MPPLNCIVQHIGSNPSSMHSHHEIERHVTQWLFFLPLLQCSFVHLRSPHPTRVRAKHPLSLGGTCGADQSGQSTCISRAVGRMLASLFLALYLSVLPSIPTPMRSRAMLNQQDSQRQPKQSIRRPPQHAARHPSRRLAQLRASRSAPRCQRRQWRCRIRCSNSGRQLK